MAIMMCSLPFVQAQPCNICGDALPEVGDPNGFVTDPISQLIVTCSSLQERALDGELTPAQCSSVQDNQDPNTQDNCRCQPEGGWEMCNICGDDTPEIGNPPGIVTDPITGLTGFCSELQMRGDGGELTPQECSSVQENQNPNTQDNCRCRPDGGWEVCYICGDETVEIGNPAGTVIDPTLGMISTCSSVQMKGDDGVYSSDECSTIQSNNSGCACSGTAAPAMAPVTDAPISSPTIDTTNAPSLSPSTSGGSSFAVPSWQLSAFFLATCLAAFGY